MGLSLLPRSFATIRAHASSSRLMTIKGSRELLVGKIQERYGIAKDEARKQIDDYFTSQGY